MRGVIVAHFLFTNFAEAMARETACEHSTDKVQCLPWRSVTSGVLNVQSWTQKV